jgi:hypothetical protein
MRRSIPTAALVCGVLGLLGAVVTYWLVVPGLLLGLAAIALGWRARRDHRELANVAITLGVVAMLLVPAVIQVADGAEEWGRDCALHPESDPNC